MVGSNGTVDSIKGGEVMMMFDKYHVSTRVLDQLEDLELN
jgi:hypothetical protein